MNALELGDRYRITGLAADAELIICHMERDNGVSVVHVQLNGIQTPNLESQSESTTHMAHLAMTREAVEESIGELIEKKASPDDGWEDAYARWSLDYGSGIASIWTLPIFDVLQVLESLQA